MNADSYGDALDMALDQINEQRKQIEALTAQVGVLREALQITHELYVQSSCGYGFARPDNPHNYFPDFECCSPEEIAAHSKACEDYDAGRKISGDSWGVGTYCDEYLPAIKALATTPESALRDVRKAEREKCADVCEKSDRYRGDYFSAKIREME